MKWLDWYGTYEENNKPYYVPEAYTHPAKMAIGLCRRIFEFMEEKGMLHKGDVVVDPFNGIGTTLLLGTTLGYKCIGVELEEKFVQLTEANIEKHKAMFEATGRTMPIVIKGDSRQLSKLIQEQIQGIISSPPYADSVNSAKSGFDFTKAKLDYKGRMWHKDRVDYTKKKHDDFAYGKTKGQIGALKDGDISAVITSPAYADISTGAGGLNTKPATKDGQQTGRSAKASSQDTDQKYGKTDGQIARLKDKGIDAVISSPPYSEGLGHGGNPTKIDKKKGLDGFLTQYGKTEGQIGKLKDNKDIDAAITSPPFEDSIGSDDPKKRGGLYRDPKRANDKSMTGTYGKSEGQIGKEKAETYWEAMRQVYIECWKILREDGHIAIVIKDFYRKGQRVPLCDNTVRLLESIGFETVYRVRAWTLTETKHDDLFKGEVVNRKERKSFFRRNYETKFPDNRIDWEEVLIAKKVI